MPGFLHGFGLQVEICSGSPKAMPFLRIEISRPAKLQERLLWCAALVFTLVGFTGCNRTQRAQVAFERARQTFIHGNLVQCQKEAEQGYRLFSRVSPQWAWKFKILEAQSLLWQSNYPAVLKLLDSVDQGPAPTDANISILTIRGIAHARQFDLPTATRELEEAKQMCAHTTANSCGEVSQAWGIFALGQNHFSDALRSFEQALSLARINGDRFLETTSLLNLVGVLAKEGRFDEALDRSTAATEAATSIGAGDIALAAQINVGWSYFGLGDYERALEALLEAEKRAQQLGDVYAEDTALTDVGYIQMEMHHFDLAEQAFQRALSLAKGGNSEERVYDALQGMAEAAMRNNSLTDASQYAQRAFEIARKSGNQLDQLDPVLVQGQIAARRGDRAQAERQFRMVESDSTAPVYLKWEAQHSLARLYEDEKPPHAVDQEYRAALATMGSARDSVQHTDFQLSFLANGTPIYDDYIHFLVTRGRTNEALRWADYSRARTLAEGLGFVSKGANPGPPPLDAPELASRTESTVLFYWLGERSSYLWAITPKQVQLFSLPSSAEIEAVIERYNRALGGPQDVLDSGNMDGQSLYQMLIEPANKLLSPGQKIIIIPDGKLNRLNFETLLVPEPTLHYWIDDATIVNASSLRLLTRHHASKGKFVPKLLLVGDVVSPSQEYPELANAAVEMASVEKHFPAEQQRVLQHEHATAAAYLAGNPDQFSYIHFVTHAIASRTSPLDSAIILSRNNDESGSFKLYARDIIQHPVKADLVTISSCYSAGSRAYAGEGLVGLSWAFVRAGAHNVIAALWEASDLSTGQLMDKFYDGLSRGETPDSALRSAKLSLLHSRTAFRKPFYWGPFQLYAGS